jgi:hypothetical protein
VRTGADHEEANAAFLDQSLKNAEGYPEPFDAGDRPSKIAAVSG